MPSVRRRAPLVRATVLFTIAGLSLAACRKKPAPAPAQVPSTVNQDSIDAAARARAAAEQAARDAAARDSAARAQARLDSIVNAARATLNAPVYFDYDAADLREDARGVLEAKLPILTANAGLRIRIAGHTDSRGSDEYNLALGQRRASAVKDWLTGRGIDGSRVEIVSFGEERGTCTDEAESCWSQNRRAEFEVTAGGERLTVPGGAQ
ncbi:MAG: OmpA family protein [Gemmatirosa sp.]